MLLLSMLVQRMLQRTRKYLTIYSIIAVHGLAANPVYTWVKKVPNSDSAKVGRLNEQGLREILWLKHFLPARLPNARILKYNYGSAYLVDAPKESLRSI